MFSEHRFLHPIPTKNQKTKQIEWKTQTDANTINRTRETFGADLSAAASLSLVIVDVDDEEEGVEVVDLVGVVDVDDDAIGCSALIFNGVDGFESTLLILNVLNFLDEWLLLLLFFCLFKPVDDDERDIFIVDAFLDS